MKQKVYLVRNLSADARDQPFSETEKIFADEAEARDQFDKWVPGGSPFGRMLPPVLKPGRRSVQMVGTDGADIMAFEIDIPVVQKAVHYAVVGRCASDEQDSFYIYKDVTQAQAEAKFRKQIVKDSGPVPEGVDEEDRCILITAVLRSDAPLVAMEFEDDFS